MVSRFCLGGFLLVSLWCLGCVSVVSWLNELCLDCVSVVSWWLFGGFGRVLVVSCWSCRATVAEITAKIGSNKKGEAVLLYWGCMLG